MANKCSWASSLAAMRRYNMILKVRVVLASSLPAQLIQAGSVCLSFSRMSLDFGCRFFPILICCTIPVKFVPFLRTSWTPESYLHKVYSGPFTNAQIRSVSGTLSSSSHLVGTAKWVRTTTVKWNNIHDDKSPSWWHIYYKVMPINETYDLVQMFLPK